jgi:hypothetical protein
MHPIKTIDTTLVEGHLRIIAVSKSFVSIRRNCCLKKVYDAHMTTDIILRSAKTTNRYWPRVATFKNI